MNAVVFGGHVQARCAVSDCGKPTCFGLRVKPSTVLPLCADCEAKRAREVLMDGDSLLFGKALE